MSRRVEARLKFRFFRCGVREYLLCRSLYELFKNGKAHLRITSTSEKKKCREGASVIGGNTKMCQSITGNTFIGFFVGEPC